MPRRSRAIFLTIAVTAGVLAPAHAADAGQVCMATTSFDRYGGGVSVEICYSDAGGPPTIGGGEAEHERLWNRYGCSSSIGRGWESGDEMLIVVDHEVGAEWMDWLDLNPTARWASFAFWCDPNDGPPVGAPWFSNDPGAGDRASYASTIFLLGDPPVNPRDLRDAAAARIQIPDPDPKTAPDFDVVDSTITVQVPTWFWIQHEWAPIGPEVEVRNNATVVVTAEPINATWEFGDGTVIECPDGGTPWVAGSDDSASTCSHTYESSSAGLPANAYSATVTVEWRYSWWLNGTFIEFFGPSEPVTAFPLPVGEIQALSGADS